MIQLLIVDDEIHCAEGVKHAINWEEIGVDRVYTSYSMLQAQKIIQNEEIDILITDVEMPMGDGFDLIQWIQEKEYSLVIVMLTSYAAFPYAKRAIEYQCLDYLLKPISKNNLLQVGKRAVNAVMENRRKELDRTIAEHWNSNERNRIQNFWREILRQYHYLDSASIVNYAKKEHIVFDNKNLYLPILYKIYLSDPSILWSQMAEDLKEKLWTKVFYDQNQVVLVDNDTFILAIAGYSSNHSSYYEQFRFRSKKFINNVFTELKIKTAVYLGEFKSSGEVAAQYAELVKMDLDNVTEHSGVYDLSVYKNKIKYERPDIEKWIKDFAEGNYEISIERIESYVDSLSRQRLLNQESLTQLLQDFMQAFYVAVAEEKLQAHLLIKDEESVAMYGRASSSVRDFMKWIRHIIEKASQYIHMAHDNNSVAGFIKTYINHNLSEDLNRNQIAAQVYMSPDYVSRVFRQQFGIQLSEYITEKRMAEARNLLAGTNLPVAEVAYKVGYNNVAYFIRVFRIRNKITPVQYRIKEQNHICGT